MSDLIADLKYQLEGSVRSLTKNERDYEKAEEIFKIARDKCIKNKEELEVRIRDLKIAINALENRDFRGYPLGPIADKT